MTNYAIKIHDLHKSYGGNKIFQDYSLYVKNNCIHILVGPNGSGKTTLLEIIEGLRPYEKGSIELLNTKVRGRDHNLFKNIGVQLQDSGLRNRLKVYEEITLIKEIYDLDEDIDQMIDTFGLRKHLNTYCADLSGGQKRRLLLMLASIHQPDLLILDEPTSGLDAQARHNTWEFLKKYTSKGKTVFMTVHNLEEAEKYGDYLTLIHHGQTVVEGKPSDIMKRTNISNVILLPNQYETSIRKSGFEHLVSRENIMIYCKGQEEVERLMDVLKGQNVSTRDTMFLRAHCFCLIKK